MQQAKKKRVNKTTKEEENPEVQQARTTILAEIAKEERSLEAIASALSVLEAAPPLKLKRAVAGDWKLVFASDAAAVEPFSVGTASGPFVVLEDIYHRMQTTGNTVQSIEGERAPAAIMSAKFALHSWFP